MAAVVVPAMVAVMVSATAVITVTVGPRFDVERVCRAVTPPMMPSVLIVVVVTVPIATLPMVVKVMPAHLVEDPEEEFRRQSMEDHLPLVALLVVPAPLMLAFTAEHRLGANGQHGQCRDYCQS